MKTANNGTHEYLLTSHYALGIGAEQITGFICPINSEAVRWGKAAPSWGRRGGAVGRVSRVRSGNLGSSLPASARCSPIRCGLSAHSCARPCPLSVYLSLFLPIILWCLEPPADSAESFRLCPSAKKRKKDPGLGPQGRADGPGRGWLAHWMQARGLQGSGGIPEHFPGGWGHGPHHQGTRVQRV